MCEKPKNQHYVPRFYLEYFSIPETRNTKYPQIWAFSKNKEDGEPFRTGIHNIAVERYLYSPIDLKGNRNWAIEDKLCALEGLFAKIWGFHSEGFVDLDNISIRRPIAWFLATQILRNPRMINEGKLVHKKMVDYIETLPRKVLPPHIEKGYETYKEPSEDFFHRFFLDFLNSNSKEVMECLLDKRWSIIHTENPVFITSDNPVIISNSRSKTYGLKTPGTIILFPLSPTKVLILDDLYKQPQNQYYLLNSNGPGQINYYIWTNVLKFIFSPRDIYEVLKEIVDFVDLVKDEAIPNV